MSSRLEQLSVGVGGGQGVLTGDLNDFSTATRFSTSNYFFHFLYLNLSRTSIAPPRETAVVLACSIKFDKFEEFGKFGKFGNSRNSEVDLCKVLLGAGRVSRIFEKYSRNIR